MGGLIGDEWRDQPRQFGKVVLCSRGRQGGVGGRECGVLRVVVAASDSSLRLQFKAHVSLCLLQHLAFDIC